MTRQPSKEEMLYLLKKSAENNDKHSQWNECFKKNKFEKILDNVDLRNFNLEEADLRKANLEGADLRGANLRGANLEGANLKKANLSHACLKQANIAQANLESAKLKGSFLNNIKAILVEMKHASLDGADLTEAELMEAKFDFASLENTILHKACVEGAVFQCAFLKKAILTHCDANNCTMECAELEEADLRNANLHNVNFENAQLEKCIVNAVDLEHLKPDQITKFQKRKMIVNYGLGDLKKSYSGFSRTVHILSILCFILPYIIFTMITIIQSQQLQNHIGVIQKSILELLFDKVLENGYLYLIPFFVLVLFHFTRMAINIIVIKLEKEEEIKGVVCDLQIISLKKALTMKKLSWEEIKKISRSRERRISLMFHFSEKISKIAFAAMIWHMLVFLLTKNINVLE